jgi:hypothetical protein
MTIPGQENVDIFHDSHQTGDDPEELFNSSQKIDALSREITAGSSKNDQGSTVHVVNSVDEDTARIERRVLRKIDLR